MFDLTSGITVPLPLIQIFVLEMMVAHYRKILVSFYAKDLCHSISLPFQTEKDASHIFMTHALLCITYFLFFCF